MCKPGLARNATFLWRRSITATKETDFMKIQRNLDFDAPPPVDESKQVAIDASLPPPPLVRPDRQIVYPDARTHYDWPPAEGLHDRDTITVDRVTDDIDGPAHRFVIKRGDTVEAYMAHDRFHTGRVIGISHAEQKVRVAWSEDSDRGGWWNVGAIYPAAEPEPERTASARPLSQIVEQANDENAPPGGWSGTGGSNTLQRGLSSRKCASNRRCSAYSALRQ